MIDLFKVLFIITIVTFIFSFVLSSVSTKEKILVMLFFSMVLIIMNLVTLLGFDTGQYILVYILVPLIYIFSLYLLIRKDLITIEFIFLITIFQNILLTLASNYINKSVFSSLMMFKEVYIILLVLTSIINFILKNRLSINRMISKTNKVDQISILIGIMIIIYVALYGAPSINTRLVSARQVAIPILFYIFGRAIKMNKNNLIKYFNFVKLFTLIIVFFGVIELIIGDKFWLDIGISNFIKYKDMEKWNNVMTGLPGNFYSYDFYNQIGRGIRRMVSFIMEPTTLAQLISASMMYTYWIKQVSKNNIHRYICTFILSIGLLLTLGKGGIIVAIVCIMYCMKYIKKYKLTSKFMSFMTVIISAVIIIYSFKNKTSISFHLKGLIENLMSTIKYPVGRGIGMSGNFANLYATGNYDVGHGESYIGIIIGQFGLLGLIIFGLFYLYMYKELCRIAKNNMEICNIANVCTGLLYGCLLASFLSESAISFISTFMIFPIIGIVISMDILQRKNIDDEGDI